MMPSKPACQHRRTSALLIGPDVRMMCDDCAMRGPWRKDATAAIRAWKTMLRPKAAAPDYDPRLIPEG